MGNRWGMRLWALCGVGALLSLAACGSSGEVESQKKRYQAVRDRLQAFAEHSIAIKSDILTKVTEFDQGLQAAQAETPEEAAVQAVAAIASRAEAYEKALAPAAVPPAPAPGEPARAAAPATPPSAPPPEPAGVPPAEAEVGAACAEATAGCAQGKGKSCLSAGMLHHKGLGVPVDLEQADALYRQACALKEAEGCFLAGGFAKEGTRGAPNEADAIRYLGEACDLGHGLGCLGLSVALEGRADDPSRDRLRAATERGCELGVGSACFMAGLIQDEGKGVPRDPQAAVAFYEKGCAADAGMACTNAGVSLLGGAATAGSPDAARALRLLERACALDAAQGCLSLGVVYLQGKLVAKDPARGETHVRKACSLGFEPACELLK